MLATPRHPGARARSPHADAAIALLFVVAAALPGCGSATRTSSPAATLAVDSPFSGSGAGGDASGTFADRRLRAAFVYPLAVGNRWDYLLRSRIVAIPDAGDPSVIEESARWSAQVINTARVGAHDYFQVAEGDPRDSWPPPPQYFVRQDQEGLYELDRPVLPASVTAAEPLAVSRAALASLERSQRGKPHGAAFVRAAAQATAHLEQMRRELLGGPAATAQADTSELTVLRYPLQVGAEWIVRASPEFGRVVQGQDEMVLPIGRVKAWRVLGFSELYGPETRVHFWYGRAGLVRVHLHDEITVVDDTGALIGRAIAEYDQALARLSLTGPVEPLKLTASAGDR